MILIDLAAPFLAIRNEDPEAAAARAPESAISIEPRGDECMLCVPYRTKRCDLESGEFRSDTASTNGICTVVTPPCDESYRCHPKTHNMKATT